MAVSGQSGLITVETTKQDKLGLLVLDTLLQLMGAKRTRLAQHINGFEQAGFARTIVTADQIDSRVELECDLIEISEMGQAELTDCHALANRPYRRIGITTYRLLFTSGS